MQPVAAALTKRTRHRRPHAVEQLGGRCHQGIRLPLLAVVRPRRHQLQFALLRPLGGNGLQEGAHPAVRRLRDHDAELAALREWVTHLDDDGAQLVGGALAVDDDLRGR